MKVVVDWTCLCLTAATSINYTLYYETMRVKFLLFFSHASNHAPSICVMFFSVLKLLLTFCRLTNFVRIIIVFLFLLTLTILSIKDNQMGRV
jgi:hypothetical protein